MKWYRVARSTPVILALEALDTCSGKSSLTGSPSSASLPRCGKKRLGGPKVYTICGANPILMLGPSPCRDWGSRRCPAPSTRPTSSAWRKTPAYFLATGVADHDFSWVHATEAKITDPVIHQLLDKVRVGAPPTDNVERYRQGATVTIRTKDGRTFSSTVYAPKGSGILGIDWADVDAKYRTLVPNAQLSDRQVEESLHMIHDFRHVTHVSALTDLLQARP
jgi:hypothetical protein